LARARPFAAERTTGFVDENFELALGDLPENHFGDVGERAMRRLNVFLAENVAHANAQVLRILEAVQHRHDVFRPARQLLERVIEPVVGRQLIEHERIHQLVDHARIRRENIGEVRARPAHSHVQIERRGVETEQLPQHTFAADRIAHAGEVDERGVGIRSGGNCLKQTRRNRCQKMPAAARR